MQRDKDERRSRGGPLDAMAGADPAPSIFATPQWFETLRTHCFAEARVHLAEARTTSAAAWLPLIQDGDRLEALANYYSFSYGPLFSGRPGERTRLALLTRIAADLRADWHRVGLYPLVDRAEADQLRDAFRRAGWIALLTHQSDNHRLSLDGRDFAAWWAERPKPLRETVRRKGRDGALRFGVHERVGETLWADYMRVYAASWKNAEPFPAMVRAIADAAAAQGGLRLGFALLGDVPVAAQLWTIEGDTACIHKIAHARDHDAASPGTLLSHHMFRHAIERDRVAHIDYGTGGNAYKRDWMDEARPMLRLDCFDPRRAGQWLPALRTRISQLVGR